MVERRKRRVGIHLWASDKLHQVANQIRKEARTKDLSRQQEWLWSVLVAELEYRRARTNRFEERCHCDLCVPPFEGRPHRVSMDHAEEAELQIQLRYGV